MNQPGTLLQFDFNPVHSRENNFDSEAHLEQHRHKFNEQCFRALKLMLAGEKLTNYSCLTVHDIGDIKRRAKDLIDGYHIPVRREWALDEHGNKQPFKWFYIAEVDRSQVMQIVIDKLEIKKAS